MGGAYRRSRLASVTVREKSVLVPANVVLYTTSWCPYCHQAKRLLASKKAPFTEVDVDDRPDLRSFLVSTSGQQTVPQVFINGESIGGFTELASLDRRGLLDQLLGAPPPVDLAALPTCKLNKSQVFPGKEHWTGFF